MERERIGNRKRKRREAVKKRKKRKIRREDTAIEKERRI